MSFPKELFSDSFTYKNWTTRFNTRIKFKFYVRCTCQVHGFIECKFHSWNSKIIKFFHWVIMNFFNTSSTKFPHRPTPLIKDFYSRTSTRPTGTKALELLNLSMMFMIVFIFFQIIYSVNGYILVGEGAPTSRNY